MFPYIVRTEYGSRCIFVGAGSMLSGHRFLPRSLHLTMPHLADACALWMRKGKPLISAMYCRSEFGSLVGGGTCQSLGTQLRMAVLHNCKVLCNFHCIFCSALHCLFHIVLS